MEDSVDRAPAWPEIPRVAVRREWPYFKEDEDTESLDCVTNDVDSLWRNLSDATSQLDDPEFFGPTAEFRLKGDAEPLDLDRDSRRDARIAVANYRHVQSQWGNLLTKPCWRGITTYPPVWVVAELMKQHFIGDVDAVQLLMFTKDHNRAIECLERDRHKAVATVAPAMTIFQASLWAQDFGMGVAETSRARDDSPTDVDIENGRAVFARMGTRTPSKEAFRKAFRAAGFSASNKKAGLVYEVVR